MDEFITGPKDFYMRFISSNSNVLKNRDGSFQLILGKNLQFAQEWEIGIVNIILKSPLNLDNVRIDYSIPGDNKDGSSKSVLNIDNISLSSPRAVIDRLNGSLPQKLKENVKFSLNDDNFAVIETDKISLKFDSSDILEILGITFDQFQSGGYQIIPFDIFPHEGGIPPKKQETVLFSAQWPPRVFDENYMFLIYLLYDCSINIDHNRNILLDYIP